MKNNSKKLLNTIAQAIYDKKGFNILAIDVQEICSMTDYFVIAEGSVERHVKAISNAVTDTVRELGQKPYHVEGATDADWMVIDYGSILVHIFVPEQREKYALEELWHEGKVVDLELDMGPNLSNEEARNGQ